MPSAATPPTPANDIQVQLEYLADLPLYKSTKPLQYVPGFENDSRSTVHLSPGPPEILHDVRTLSPDTFALDDNGFRYIKAPTKFCDWNSQDAIAREYMPQMEALLKREVEGVDEVVLFDARIRYGESSGTKTVDGMHYNPFARQVHVDQTESSIITKIRSMTELKADFLLRGRSRIINVWRPIRHPVYDCGLAIADGGALKDGDVIECDRMRRDDGQFWDTMGVVKYREGYRWYYMSEQAEEDVLIFKNYDSDKRVKARHCLHTAFDLPSPPPHSPPRQSIELRALIFTYPSPTLPAQLSPHPHAHTDLRTSTLAPLAHSLRPYPSSSSPSPAPISCSTSFSSHPPLANADLLPETFHVPASGVTIADVALLETEVARLRALLGAQTRSVVALREELEVERGRRRGLERRVARVVEVCRGDEDFEGEFDG